MERKVSLFQCTIFWKAMWWLCNMCTFYKRFSRSLAFSSWTKGGGVQSATVPEKLLQFQLISGCYHSAGHLYNSLEELMQSKWGEFPVKGGGTEDSRHAQIPAPSHRGAQRRSCSQSPLPHSVSKCHFASGHAPRPQEDSNSLSNGAAYNLLSTVLVPHDVEQ